MEKKHRLFLEKLELINKSFSAAYSQVSDNKELSIKELSILINREAASEYTIYRKEAFANNNYIQQLIKICEANQHDPIILRNILSAIGFICVRYSYFSDLAFEYLTRFTYENSDVVKLSIVKNIFYFPQFDYWDNKWSYILSIPQIRPFTESIDYFSYIIERYIQNIPIELVYKVVDTLESYINSKKTTIHTRLRFTDLIHLINTNRGV